MKYKIDEVEKIDEDDDEDVERIFANLVYAHLHITEADLKVDVDVNVLDDVQSTIVTKRNENVVHEETYQDPYDYATNEPIPSD